MPTWLVHEFAPIFAPFFAHVFNVSLEKGYLPASQKKAIVYPGLEKPSLDPDDLSIKLSSGPSQTLALFLSCLGGLFMLSCSSI